MGFPRQEYWGGLPFPPPGDLPDSRTEPVSPMAPDRQILSCCAIWDIYIYIYIYIKSSEEKDRLAASSHPLQKQTEKQNRIEIPTQSAL